MVLATPAHINFEAGRYGSVSKFKADSFAFEQPAKVERLCEHHPEIKTLHENDALVRILLHEWDDMLRPTVDRKKQSHCLLPDRAI